MDYTFTKMDSTGRPHWSAQHSDTTVVGFGRSKLKAIRHLEIDRADRQDALTTIGEIPLTADGEVPASWTHPA